MKIWVREGGCVVKVCCVLAKGVSDEGRREIVGLDTFTAETGAAWTAFLRELVSRGLCGVKLVVSDSHQGARRCHRIDLARCGVAALIRTISARASAYEVAAKPSRVVEPLEVRFSDEAAMLADSEVDITAFRTFPGRTCRQIWSNNPQERLNCGIRRRSDVVGICPNRESVTPLRGAVLSEQHHEW